MRVISADANPNGPGLVEEPVEAAIAGSYKGRFQPVHSGSYGIVAQALDLGTMGSLTFVRRSGRRCRAPSAARASCRPTSRRARVGFALAIGEDGSAEAILGATRVKTRVPLEERQWYRVFAIYD